MGSLVVTLTAPTEYPVTLAEAKAHAVIEHSDDDTQASAWIAAATNHVQKITGLSLVRQKKRLYLDKFSDAMCIPNGPVQIIDAITYIDGDGAEQTLATSVYSYITPENVVRLGYGQTWPAVRSQKNAVWVDYWTGYYTQVSPESAIDLQADVPQDLKHAILMLVAEFDRNRESRNELETYSNPAFDFLISLHRVYS